MRGSGLHRIKEEWPSVCSSEVYYGAGLGQLFTRLSCYSPGVLAVGGGAEETHGSAAQW